MTYTAVIYDPRDGFIWAREKLTAAEVLDFNRRWRPHFPKNRRVRYHNEEGAVVIVKPNGKILPKIYATGANNK